MYACHIHHNKLQVNTSFLSPNQSVNDVFIFSGMHQVCNQLYSWFSQGKHAQLHSSGRACFCQKYLDIWGQERGWSNPFLQFTLFYFITVTPILSPSLHNIHLKRLLLHSICICRWCYKTEKALFPACSRGIYNLQMSIEGTSCALRKGKTG